jgi:integrase/recombinase XerC
LPPITTRRGAKIAKKIEMNENNLTNYQSFLKFERNLTDNSVEAYISDIKKLQIYAESKGLELETLAQQDIEDFLCGLRDVGISPTSQKRILVGVRSFYKFLLRRKMVDHDPAHGVVGPKKEKNLPSFLRESEMDRLLDGDFFSDDFVGARDHLILLMFYSTGIRLSELTGLEMVNVDVDLQQLKVTGKRNKQRVIPFGSEMRLAIEDYVKRRMALGERLQVSSSFFVEEKSGLGMKPEKVRVIVRKYL